MTLVAPDDWVPQGVAELEDRAWEALRETSRSICVTAGAGAGKTEFLAQKATYLLQTGLCRAPKRILAISFKRDAAVTLAERVERRCGPERARRFVSVTFDAFSKGLVDQFRMALPEQYRPPSNYRISFPSADELNEFLQRQGIHYINTQQLLRALVSRRLCDEDQENRDKFDQLLDPFWRDQYENYDEPRLTFPMINRLAEYLIRTNERIKRAVRVSFPVVFLDEFQDTQTSQFELLRAAFDESEVVFTAVGDEKQSIMGWAGAMQDPFGTFARHYDALPISFLLNWRSHADLVAVQHVIASNIDPEVEPVEARGECTVTGSVSAIWEFPDEETEIETLAEWIAAEVGDGIAAHDIAILVRARANDAEKELESVLADRGLVLRNLARNVGEISIEDLLSEELTQIAMPFLRLATGKRQSKEWTRAIEILGWLESIQLDDELQLQRVNQDAERIIQELRNYLAQGSVEQADPQEVVSAIINAVGEPSIRRSTPTYQRDVDFDRVRHGFELLLRESLRGAETWREVLDRFEGRNQVPLLTVHKSKGMEFHTMIFFGLDSQTWWSLKPDRQEEKNSFFVAFTRAKQRAFFTSCQKRGGRIAWLEDLLADAVPRIDGTDIV